jgi:hypothetical protein
MSSNPEAWIAITHPNYATTIMKLRADESVPAMQNHVLPSRPGCARVTVVASPTPTIRIHIPSKGKFHLTLQSEACNPSELIPQGAPSPTELNSRSFIVFCEGQDGTSTVQVPAEGSYSVMGRLWQNGVNKGRWHFDNLALRDGSVIDFTQEKAK